MIYQLAAEADVIAVAKLREPQIWITSELIVMTGQSTALVERTLKGKEQPSKITVQVVRHLDIESLVFECPQKPSPKVGPEVPVTPAIPSKFTTVDDTDRLKNADKVIVFLHRGEDDTLNAIDGFLYTLPYSLELEGVVSVVAKNQAQQDGSGQPATRTESK